METWCSGSVHIYEFVFIAVVVAFVLALFTFICCCCCFTCSSTNEEKKKNEKKYFLQEIIHTPPPPTPHKGINPRLKKAGHNNVDAIEMSPQVSPSPAITGDSHEGSEAPRLWLSSALFYKFAKILFPFHYLSEVTDGLSDGNLLGQVVHKGILLNGTEVAIKQVEAGLWPGDREFLWKVATLMQVRHPNLVSLLGCCISNCGRIRLLVYEFVPNNSLDYHLHGKGVPTL